MTSMKINKRQYTLLRSITRSAVTWSALTAALCLGAIPVFAAQDQQDQSSAPVQEQNPAMAPEAPSQYMPPQFQTAPPTLTLPAGTTISVRTSGWLSSDQNHPGDTFTVVLDQPLVVDGWVVARRGQAVQGKVDMAIKANRNSGVSQLGLSLAEVTFVDGQQMPLQTQLVQSSTGPTNQKVAGTVATTTVLGTVIGGIAGGGTGAAIGAVAGATGGMAVAMSTRGRPTVVYPETLLSFRLTAPVSVSTERSQAAFLPVSQQDYDRPARNPNRQRPGAAYPRYPGPYYYPYWYGPEYPGFFIGGYYGFGRGYYRGFRGRGFRR
jgi:hypothetical protein